MIRSEQRQGVTPDGLQRWVEPERGALVGVRQNAPHG